MISPAFSQKARRFFNPPPSELDGVKGPWRLFWVATVVRLLYMTLAHTWRIKHLEGNFSFGFEAGRIGAALATGRGYADPFSNFFVQHTGPTAWLPPLYPLFVGGIFKLFGVYTPFSAWVILAVGCVLSGLTARAVWEMGARLAGMKVARWAGWLWVLYPAAMQYAVKWIWEMTQTTALFAWVIVLAMRMRSEPEVRVYSRWAWFGFAWALIGLSNSTLLLFLPVCGLWILGGNWKTTAQKANCAGAVLASLLFVATISPWVARNYVVFHKFIPMRGNFGAELYLGNGPGANGLEMGWDHPFLSAPQLRLYAQMGEVAYARMRGEAAMVIIKNDPAHFMRNNLKRIDYFWFSVPHPADDAWWVEFFRTFNFAVISITGLLGLALALKNRLPAAAMWAWAFILLPIPYYAVTVHARFRHPLEPMICVLSVYLFQSATPRKKKLEPAV